jgi:hypothetical protein
MKKLAISGLIFFALSGNVKAQIAEGLCSSYMAVVEQSLNLRQSGVPINIAQNMADSALRTNPQLWRFLMRAIGTAYKDPQFIANALRDGSLNEMCVREVRGY